MLANAESDSIQCHPARSPIPYSVILLGVWPRTVSSSAESDSIQCHPARSSTPYSVIFPESDSVQYVLAIFWFFGKLISWLHPVLATFGFSKKIFQNISKINIWTLDSLKMQNGDVWKPQKILWLRAACLPILDFHKFNFLTPCSVSLCGVTNFANISAKTNLSAIPF